MNKLIKIGFIALSCLVSLSVYSQGVQQTGNPSKETMEKRYVEFVQMPNMDMPDGGLAIVYNGDRKPLRNCDDCSATLSFSNNVRVYINDVENKIFRNGFPTISHQVVNEIVVEKNGDSERITEFRFRNLKQQPSDKNPGAFERASKKEND